MIESQRFTKVISVMLFPETEPPRSRGLLELNMDREEAAKYFAALLNLPEIRGLFCPREISSLRSKMVRHLAEVLLGDDFDCEVLT